ncbi:putative membrane protein [Clostridium beijerinckii]|uniref:Membrane protein n=1 Tax=Clostridium beijerinckii TaxID=1520 RepID=A0AAE5EXF8_CLOBE|nr:putative membrane protein [Clostridium beijerinckii]
MDIKKILEILIIVLQGLSITIIVWGVFLCLINFIKVEISINNRSNIVQKITSAKNYLGSYILLGLEILISADIIDSILNPTMHDILRLAAIVIIRTVISYFLNKEMKATENNQSS